MSCAVQRTVVDAMRIDFGIDVDRTAHEVARACRSPSVNVGVFSVRPACCQCERGPRRASASGATRTTSQFGSAHAAVVGDRRRSIGCVGSVPRRNSPGGAGRSPNDEAVDQPFAAREVRRVVDRCAASRTGGGGVGVRPGRSARASSRCGRAAPRCRVRSRSYSSTHAVSRRSSTSCSFAGGGDDRGAIRLLPCAPATLRAASRTASR